MTIHKLSSKKVETAKPGKYMDGGGLHLEVTKTGNKKWNYRYTLNNKRAEIQLGNAVDISLAEARDVRAENKRRLSSGLAPLKWREMTEQAQQASKLTGIPTFTESAAQYIYNHRRSWKNKKHARQWVSTLKTYVRPVIGEKPVSEITTEEILEILTPIWYSKTETAKRVQTRIENILDYAAAKKQRDSMNPARWRGHLDKLLPKPTKVKVVTNHPAMPYEMVPELMSELRQANGIAPLALQLLIHTALRTSEVLGARWDEIDGTIWTVPASRMKAGKEHQIPLTPAALAVINQAPRISNNPFIFHGKVANRPLSNMALLILMRKRGFGKGGDRGHYVPHGFRSSFRDWSGEVSNHPRDVCEMALAHAIKDKVEAAYRRGSLLNKRRVLMADWSNYLVNNQSNGTESLAAHRASSDAK